MTCPRCAGTLLPDANGDRSCLQCGYEYISPAQLAASQREIARIEALRQAGYRRIDRPSKYGMKL